MAESNEALFSGSSVLDTSGSWEDLSNVFL